MVWYRAASGGRPANIATILPLLNAERPLDHKTMFDSNRQL